MTRLDPFYLIVADATRLAALLPLGVRLVQLRLYPIQLKQMKWAPQGLDRVREWKRRAGAVPLVGIGGLTPERFPSLFAAGAAVVTDIQQAAEPAARSAEWIAVTREHAR